MARKATTNGRPTVYDVAQRAGVSIATVSRFFSAPDKLAGDTRDRVARSVEDLGYVQNSAARLLAGAPTDVVALCLPNFGDEEAPLDLTQSDGVPAVLHDPLDAGESDLYYSEILRGAEIEARRCGRTLTVFIDRDEALTDRLARMAGQVGGVVVVSGAMSDAVAAQLNATIPVVLVAARSENSGVSTIKCDNTAGQAAITSHLIEAHDIREPAFVGGPEESPDSAARFRGFCQALAQHGIEPPLSPTWQGDFTRAGGVEIGRRILASDDLPPAIVCANDQTAIGVLDVLRRASVAVPRQVAVTGFDDMAAARWTVPSLTTVRQPITMIGRVAVSLLMQPDSTRSKLPRDLVLPVELVLRRSCGC